MITISLSCQSMAKDNSKSKNLFYFSRPSPFPQLNYVGYVGIIVSVVQFFTGNYPQAGFIMVISLIIILMRSWSRLNLQKNTLTDFFAIIPYRRISVESPQRIIISEEKINRTLNSRGSTSTVSYIQYKIILENRIEKLTLKEGRNKNALLKKAREIAISASVKLDDLTTL